MEQSLNLILKELKTLNSRLDNFEQNTNNRFNEFDNRFNEFENRFNEFDNRFNDFEQKTNNNFSVLNVKIDKLSEKITAHQVENMNADNLLLAEVQSLREGVVFVNRKVADAELEINLLKQRQ